MKSLLATQASPALLGARKPCSRPSRGASRAPVCQAVPPSPQKPNEAKVQVEKNPLGIGDVLGPIGITVGGEVKPKEKKHKKEGAPQAFQQWADKAGLSLGPIGLTVGSELEDRSDLLDSDDEGVPGTEESISALSTEEWRARYETADGRVDLWVEEEFNSGSRLVGGRAVYWGRPAGYLSGEGIGESTAPRHKVKITNHFADQEIEVEVPEDRYILWEAEDQGLELPYACRMGCCTACAVKVVEGEMYQPHSLGVSRQLREQGYALMCVGFPRTDLVLETVPEDEVYMLQFGQHFEQYATDLASGLIDRDDFAIELGMLDE